MKQECTNTNLYVLISALSIILSIAIYVLVEMDNQYLTKVRRIHPASG